MGNTGKRDGENKIIREGDVAAVYMWSAANNKWEKVTQHLNCVSLL